MVVQFESSVLFVAPPYLWQTHSLGLFALSGLIGTIIAVFVGGKLIDIIANYMTAKNNGVRVPEYRLVPLIIPAIIGPVGLLIFGSCAQAHDPWIAPAVGYAMQGFGLTACSNIIATYAVDSCPGVRIIRLNIVARSLFSSADSHIVARWRGSRVFLRYPSCHRLLVVSVRTRLDRSNWSTKCKSSHSFVIWTCGLTGSILRLSAKWSRFSMHFCSWRSFSILRGRAFANGRRNLE